jgi:hypothetical protein
MKARRRVGSCVPSITKKMANKAKLSPQSGKRPFPSLEINVLLL